MSKRIKKIKKKKIRNNTRSNIRDNARVLPETNLRISIENSDIATIIKHAFHDTEFMKKYITTNTLDDNSILIINIPRKDANTAWRIWVTILKRYGEYIKKPIDWYNSLFYAAEIDRYSSLLLDMHSIKDPVELERMHLYNKFIRELLILVTYILHLKSYTIIGTDIETLLSKLESENPYDHVDLLLKAGIIDNKKKEYMIRLYENTRPMKQEEQELDKLNEHYLLKGDE